MSLEERLEKLEKQVADLKHGHTKEWDATKEGYEYKHEGMFCRRCSGPTSIVFNSETKQKRHFCNTCVMFNEKEVKKKNVGQNEDKKQTEAT